MSTQSLTPSPGILLTHIDRMMDELIALRKAVQEMKLSRTQTAQPANRLLAAQIAGDYLARKEAHNEAERTRIEQIVLHTIQEAQKNLAAMKANPSTVIKSDEMRRKLNLNND